jgi:hypothetical protein
MSSFYYMYCKLQIKTFKLQVFHKWEIAILFNSRMQRRTVVERRTTALPGNLKLSVSHDVWLNSMSEVALQV